MKKGGNGMDRSNSNHTYNGPSKALPLSLFDVKNELKQKSKLIPSDTMYKLTKEEQLIINKIKIQTEQLNKNNVTRTRAYYQFYIQYPEIHWALLGHMVSRNGGWNMTDLKGDLYTRILSEKDQFIIFFFFRKRELAYFPRCIPSIFTLRTKCKEITKVISPSPSPKCFYIYGNDVEPFLENR